MFHAIGGGLAAMLLLATPVAAQTGQPAGSGMGGHEAMGHGAEGHGMKDHAAPSAGGKAGEPMAGAADVQRCKALPHAEAMKDARCAALMKAHPDMMTHAPGHAM